MVCATGYTIALKRLSSRYPAFFLTATQALLGTFFYLPLLFLPTTTLPIEFPIVPGMAIIYLGAVITLCAYGLYNYGVKHIPASKATMFVNLIPVFSVFLGWLILDEKLSPPQFAAAGIILGAVYLSQMKDTPT
jgi:drug/metabolite transporter (DMT)-like permease